MNTHRVVMQRKKPPAYYRRVVFRYFYNFILIVSFPPELFRSDITRFK